MSDPIDHADQFRDDTMPAFPPPKVIGEIIGQFVPSGNGPLTPAIDAWPAPEPFPLPMPIPMPQPFDTPQQQLLDRLVVAHRRGDQAAFTEALDRLYELRVGTNSNTGARAPIQGQG